MASNEHRQAIAAALRQKAAYHSGASLAEWWCMLQELVTGEVDFPDPLLPTMNTNSPSAIWMFSFRIALFPAL